MSIQTINGNKPAKFVGELPHRFQNPYDESKVEENLRVEAPAECQNCAVLRLFVLTRLSREVVANAMSMEVAIQELRDHTACATGSAFDPNCPVAAETRFVDLSA